MRVLPGNEFLATPLRNVLFVTKPQVLRPLEPPVATLRQCLVFPPAHLVHRGSHLPGGVKTVEDDLFGGLGNACLRRQDVRFPHVHRDRLDLRELLLGELQKSSSSPTRGQSCASFWRTPRGSPARSRKSAR